jgi:hypothetical protein
VIEDFELVIITTKHFTHSLLRLGLKYNFVVMIASLCPKMENEGGREKQCKRIMKYKGINIRRKMLKKRFRTNIMFQDIIHRPVCISKHVVSPNPSSGKSHSVGRNR